MSEKMKIENIDLNLEDIIIVFVRNDEKVEDINQKGCELLEYSKNEGERIVMILGEEAKEVCEGLDPASVGRFIDKCVDELHALVLVGERMKPLAIKNINKIYHAGDLSEGIGFAQQLTREKDIIISCVKCFR